MRAIRSTASEAEAYRLERAYIKKFRREGYQLMNCTWGGPDELPMKINNPKKQNMKGLVIPSKTKSKNKKILKVTSKKGRKVSKIRKRR
jgi:hypothetical protein